MSEVLLIGDSIRMGYQTVVQRELGDALGPVWFPQENGAHTVNLLIYFHLWILRRQPGIIHINAGLHDLKTIYHGSRTNLIPIDFYRRNVRLLLASIRENTQAKVIWALTTPVQDDLHNTAHAQWQDFCRYNADVLAYNAAASEVCADLGVPTNDLYSVATKAGLAQIQNPDGVHFNADGCELLGRAVAEAIRSCY